MADIPRDPRQLARDILAGKISIEELAREQQRRAGAPMRPAPQQKLPERIPLPRPQQMPMPAPRPVVRQVPQQRPVPRPVAKSPPQRRVVAPPAAPMTRTAVTPQAPAAPQNPTESYQTPVRPMSAVTGALAIGKVVRNRAALRQCIVMAEVLGKPVALREEW